MKLINLLHLLTSSDVANALGLSGVDIKNFNPFAPGVDQNIALTAEKVASQIIATVSSIAAAAEGTGANKDIAYDKAVSAVSTAVVAEINDGNTTDSFNLSSTNVLNEIKTTAINQLSSNVTSSDAFETVLNKGIEAVEKC